MGGDQHFTRIDLVEAKMEITKKIGPQKAEKYFNLLSRFFSKKLSKSEFDKLCIVAVGRENIGLHNWLIRSIVTNACLSKAPPAKASKHGIPINGKAANGYQISSRQSIYRDCVLQSSRRVRTRAFRNGKFADRPSPLGPHGKPHAVTCEEAAPKVLEQQSATELHSLVSMPIKVISVEDGEEVVQLAERSGVEIRKHLTAPFGVQIHAKPAHEILSPLLSPFAPMETCSSSGKLPDMVSLRRRMEQKLEAEGIKVTAECANLLNLGLDVYLKKMIKPCLELSTNQACTSLTDVRAAMELNPRLLGEDRSLQLETMALLQQDWQMGAGSSLWDGENGGNFLTSDSLLQKSSAQMYK